ncbi:MAG: hypothetical protein ACXWOH_10500 [Bdellovibrionota bacterium]
MAGTVKFVFLIGSAAHPHHNDFRPFMTHRAQELIEELWKKARKGDASALVTAPATVRFLRFDITAGVVEVFDYDLVAKTGGATGPFGKLEWQPLSSITTGGPEDPNTFVDAPSTLRALKQATDFLPITTTNPHGDEIFNQDAITDPQNIMSITNLYHSVRGAPPGSVVEISYIGHGFLDGPVLVNSSAASGTATLRDPKDKDGRMQTDFLSNMGEDPTVSSSTPIKSGGKDALKEFKAALATNAVVRVWGCNAQGRDYETAPEKRVLVQAYYLPSRQRDKRVTGKTVDDSTVFQFEFEQSYADVHYKEDLAFYPSSNGAADTTKLKFSQTWIEIKKYIARQITKTYVFTAAEALGIECHGTLPGMGSDYETRKRGIQKVCRDIDAPECDYGYAPFIRYYEKFLGFKTDDRNYGIFDQPTVTAIRALANS